MVKSNVIWRLAIYPLLVLALAACSSTDGEEETGPAPLIDFDAERKFNKVWSRSIGDGQGDIFNRLQATVVDKTIYVAAANGEVEAIDLQSGDRIWDQDLDQLLVGGTGAGEQLVVVGSASGELIALDRDSGEQLWAEQLGGEMLAVPQINEGRVFAQTFDGQMLALDAATGQRIWSYRNNVPVLTLRGTSSPLLFRDSLIAGFANGQVVSFDQETGAVRWSTRVAVAKGDSEIERIVDVDGALLELNNLIYVASYQGRIVAIEPGSGRRIWSNEASSHVGLSAGFGNIYVTGQDGSITAFEKNGQGARWAQTVLARRKLTGSATLGSYVIVGDVEGYLHALSQVDGHLAARTKVDSDGIQVDLQTIDDGLLVYSNGGKLVLYELAEKSKGFF